MFSRSVFRFVKVLWVTGSVYSFLEVFWFSGSALVF